MKVYTTKEAPCSTFADELTAYCAALKTSGRQNELALIEYWLKRLNQKALPETTRDALWAGIRIGAAVERANAEIAWTEPLTKQAKAKTTRLMASKLQAEQKKIAADKEILKAWEAFQAGNKNKDRTWVWSKFKQSLGGARQRRFSKLVQKPHKK
jgi:hypothetical protein